MSTQSPTIDLHLGTATHLRRSLPPARLRRAAQAATSARAPRARGSALDRPDGARLRDQRRLALHEPGALRSRRGHREPRQLPRDLAHPHRRSRHADRRDGRRRRPGRRRDLVARLGRARDLLELRAGTRQLVAPRLALGLDRRPARVAARDLAAAPGRLVPRRLPRGRAERRPRAPRSCGAARESDRSMSFAAAAITMVAWIAIPLALGAWRTVTREA